VVPVEDGVRQVTCARYSADVAREAAEAGSVQELLDRITFQAVDAAEWRAWGEDGRSWYSVDDEESLATGLARYGPPS
jgi:hypothetical protein